MPHTLAALLLVAVGARSAAAAAAAASRGCGGQEASCPAPAGAAAVAAVRAQAPALLQVDASKKSGAEQHWRQIDDASPEEDVSRMMTADHVWQIDDATPEKVANVMMEMGSDVAGLQECMNIDTMQRFLGDRMQMARGSDWPNCIFYKPSANIRLGNQHGRRYLNRDNYSQRFVSYAQFFHHGKEFWLFNTHWCLHGPCGGAAGGQMHRQAAEIMTNLRQELGAGSKPALITGDLNSMMDGFDNDDGVQWLLNHGFEIAAKGPTYGGIDYIFTSRGHWDVSNHVDRTWSNPSDHAPFTVDLALLGC